jgi:cytochrome c peroxidase
MWVRYSVPASSATAAARCTERRGADVTWRIILALFILGPAQREALGADPPFYASSFESRPSAAAMAVVGRALFFDPSLSASGKIACSNCHSPSNAFAPSNALQVQRGGVDGLGFGVRAAPSLMYAQNVPPFTEHYFDDDGDDSIDQGPAGGRTWDGRAQSAHEQALLPLFSPFEMANAGWASVIEKVKRAPYAPRLMETFGAHVFENEGNASKAILLALETFQQNPAEFYPYSSKYDAWLRRRASLSREELRGLAAFNDPAKGNCARCHISSIKEGAFPQFTDFGYAALGLPRNAAIPANEQPGYFDLGLCGPLRTDLIARKEYCGMFRTPSLRNIATRRVFFHNGVIHDLKDAVRFYAERDTQPQKWYPQKADGMMRKFDDLPAAYQENLDRQPPFDRHIGDKPALNDADVADIVAFLKTLTDNYSPPP